MPRRKTNTKPSFVSRLVKFSLLFLLLSILLAWLYQNRLAIAYYFSFQSKHSKQSFQKEVEDARVYQLIKKHPNSLLGIDVSEYQGKIDWKEVDSIDQKAIHFVLVRATAGKDRKDLTFQDNWKAMATKKIIRGAYHYYRPNENSIEQANLFIRTVRLKKGDLPPVLDIENLPKTQSLDSLKKGLQRWLGRVENHYGIQPIIYTGEKYYQDFLKKDFPNYNFWIANYNGWVQDFPKNATFWQFTEKGSVKGIRGNVDVNLYNGTPRMLLYQTIR